MRIMVIVKKDIYAAREVVRKFHAITIKIAEQMDLLTIHYAKIIMCTEIIKYIHARILERLIAVVHLILN